MKKAKQLALAVLFLAAGAAGLRAAVPEGYAAVLLPQIPQEMAEIVLNIDFVASLSYSDGRHLRGGQQITRWNHNGRRSSWKDAKGNEISRVLFPLEEAKDTKGLTLRLEMKVTQRPIASNGLVKELTSQQTLPLGAVETEIAAPFPFDLVTVDVSSLTWGSGKGAVAGVRFQIEEAGKPVRKMQGILKMNGAKAAHMIVNKDAALTPAINFICAGGKQINWTGNGADLRKSGLTVTLAGDPGCSK
jgi:hypothetical protein